MLNGAYKLRAKADFLKVTKRSFKVGWEKRKKREKAIGRGGLFKVGWEKRTKREKATGRGGLFSGKRKDVRWKMD